MDANAQKKAAAEAALKFVDDDMMVGVGTGSTVNFFIDALGAMRARIKGAVASSEASAKRLRDQHIPVWSSTTPTAATSMSTAPTR